MLCSAESQLKTQLASGKISPIYLLFGNEPMLLRSYRQKILTLLCNDGGEADYMDGKTLDLPAFYEAAQLLSMFGAKRIIAVDNFEAESLSDAECKELCKFLSELPEDCYILISAAPDTFDIKKGKCAKKLLAAVEKHGIAAQLDRRTSADLKSFVQSRCKKQGKILSAKAAAFLIEHCGEDMYTLANECDKLCAYTESDEILVDIIRQVCPGVLSADPFAIARLMLRGDLKQVLSQLDTLFRLRQPTIMILANISGAFCDLARACAARAGGHTAADLTSDFAYRFAWRAQNAYRDCSGLNPDRVFAVCEVLCEADAALKSSPVDERIVLETAIIRTMQILQRGAAAC